jgi:hypothetical protein
VNSRDHFPQCASDKYSACDAEAIELIVMAMSAATASLIDGNRASGANRVCDWDDGVQ